MKSNDALRVLSRATSRQWGMVTTAQAESLGVSRVNLARMARAELLVRLAHGVYRDAGTPIDQYEDLRVAWLSTEPRLFADERIERRECDIVISGKSAAMLHESGDLRSERHEFSSPKRRQTQRGELRYRQRILQPEDVVLVEGLPTTSLEQTIIDLVEERTDLSLVADVLRDATKRTRLDIGKLTVGLSPLAARNGFTRGDGDAFLDHLSSLAGLDVKSLARRISATDPLAFQVSVDFLEHLAARRLLTSPEFEKLRSSLQTISAALGEQISASMTPVLSQLSESIESSLYQRVDTAGLARAIEAVGAAAEAARSNAPADRQQEGRG